ncbi:ferritin-like domain-containing protein [Streptomyces sp. NBC_00525]|uniref:ferritin-like domain-containing protein n=1 Tax=Streptomyces sp. NBC_00525 TaxID=2903660 RepID=UPI002E823AFE|nr:ferritin-like protein [Streptomyces sp. NBC_00525]WUC97286.1 ferritin-like protein [Streptomyces sp. NBC_00525]
MSVPEPDPSQESKIKTIEELHEYLYKGLQLEHATLPPYLTALYSLQPGRNADAWHVIRVVAVEEMLHLTLVANVLNAVGGTPDLTKSGFVPDYPTYLPCGPDYFQVHLLPFSPDALDTFLKIEKPAQAPDEESRLVPVDWAALGLTSDGAAPPSEKMAEFEQSGTILGLVPGEPTQRFLSIGEFYEEIMRGINYLEDQARTAGTTIFTGDPARQVTPEYFYSGGGDVIEVTGRDSAVAALTLVAEQGEGLHGGIYDSQDEIAHYYRFQQLEKGKFYQKGDEPGAPSGPDLHVDWTAVYPVKPDVKLADLEGDPEIHTAAKEFNQSYAAFLRNINLAYNGRPDLLLKAVWEMFRIRDTMNRLIRNPLSGESGLNAGPTFEI